MTHTTVHLRAAGVSVLLDVSGPSLPEVLHFGADLGDLTDADGAAASAGLVPGIPHSALDEPWPLTLLPGQADGWLGTPGLAGHRQGTALFPRWSVTGAPAVAVEADGAQALQIEAADAESGLALRTDLRLEASGLLRVRHTVTNTGTTPYSVDQLTVLLPVPGDARELFRVTGRHNHERTPQRAPFGFGTHQQTSRRGRPGHDSAFFLAAVTPGAGFRHGEVRGVHVGFSGNQTYLAERAPEGAGRGGLGVIGGGEVLLSGEVSLATGEAYSSPWVYFSHGVDGFDTASARFHRWLRARPQHPRTPRPVTLNTWEAVYFDHDLATLTALAEQAAAVGVERFVLDDGWFGSRRDDTSGLGDWQVSPDVWPDGLGPLAERVHALGLQFGLWFEPEMVNPDSELAREHPEWLLVRPTSGDPAADAARWPRQSRHQVLLDVAHPEAHAYLLDAISGLVTELGIDYLKWDHNRDLHEAVRGRDGVLLPAVHEQTLALYRLLGELKERCPGLEIESCASGGGRIDLGVLQLTDRIWGSDTNDPLERQQIQRYTGLVLPPELVGCHIGPPRAHTTHRTASLAFRAVTAIFGHTGLEWDITGCTPDELAAIARFTAVYRELRPLLHTGDVVRADAVPDGMLLHGVVAPDRSEAVYSLARVDTAVNQLPGRVLLPGLDPARRYRVRVREELLDPESFSATPSPWITAGGVEATGAVLGRLGVAGPQLHPEQAVLLHVTTVA